MMEPLALAVDSPPMPSTVLGHHGARGVVGETEINDVHLFPWEAQVKIRFLQHRADMSACSNDPSAPDSRLPDRPWRLYPHTRGTPGHTPPRYCPLRKCRRYCRNRFLHRRKQNFIGADRHAAVGNNRFGDGLEEKDSPVPAHSHEQSTHLLHSVVHGLDNCRYQRTGHIPNRQFRDPGIGGERRYRRQSALPHRRTDSCRASSKSH